MIADGHGPARARAWDLTNNHEIVMTPKQSFSAESAFGPNGNRLLALLSADDAARWGSQLELVSLRLREVLSEPGSPPAYVYFPTTAIVSLLYTTAEGDCAEIAVVGCEGLVGITVFMGGHATTSQAVVQSAGLAWRMSARAVREELNHSPAVLFVMLGYLQAMFTQVAQTAACNRYHSIDQLLCRRLLMGLDRSRTDHLVMTQELAASLLGVRREGVTGAALKLQQAGVIRYSRGHISVLNRPELEARTRIGLPCGSGGRRAGAQRAALAR
jgi:CRP-like cAMP-binding protein